MKNFIQFYHRTTPGGIWWNKAETITEVVYVSLMPALVLPIVFSSWIKNAAWFKLWQEAFSDAPWYTAHLSLILVHVLASFMCCTVLYLMLRAIGMAWAAHRYCRFVELTENRWQLAKLEPSPNAPLDKDMWIADQLERLGDSEFRLKLMKRSH